MYRLSSHSISRYAERTGVQHLMAVQCLQTELDSASILHLPEATQLFPSIKMKRGFRYLYWFVPRIKEHVVAAVSTEGRVVTILTESNISSGRYRKTLVSNRLAPAITNQCA